ncbi:MAG TPA: hypothetical protein VI583_00305 [Cyclobacteriaceae bacterium]|nr:hypothetical protein [Cyclobacteriaceae bacterium]
MEDIKALDTEAILGKLVHSNGLLKRDVFWTKIIAISALAVAALSFFWSVQIFLNIAK